MRKYTQKALRGMVLDGMAHDITRYDFDTMAAFLRSHRLETIGLSRGVYGMNGALLQDRDSGEFYAITARNGALFQAV